MALRIRMRQQGCTNRAFFRLVVADSRSPRDGKYVEMLGWYNPLEASLEKGVSIKSERVMHWLNQGAEITENVMSLLKKVAPQVFNQYRQKLDAKHNKLVAKRKERRKVRSA